VGSSGPSLISLSTHVHDIDPNAVQLWNNPYALAAFWSLISMVIVAIIITVYYAYTKNYFCKCCTRWVSHFAFYPTLPFTVLTKSLYGNWWDHIDQNVYLGCVPLQCRGHVQTLNDLGVKAVVNVMDEYVGPVDAYEALSMEQLYLPTLDHYEPSVHDMTMAVDFINKYVHEGSGVYVHCKGGHGRSAAVVFCWLVQSKQMTMDEAQDYLSCRRLVRRKLYQQANVNQYCSQFSWSGAIAPVRPAGRDSSTPSFNTSDRLME